MKKTYKYLLYPYLFWTFLMIVIPFLLILLYSVTYSKEGSPVTFHFTLSHYVDFFNTTNLNYLYKSIGLAFETTVICLLLGYPVAWIISQVQLKFQNALILFFILPMWINMLLRTYAWQIILGRSGVLSEIVNFLLNDLLNLGVKFEGILYTDSAVLIGMVYNFIPFMVLPIYTALLKIDNNFLEAASDLGASKKQIFLKVVFPLSVPGVVTGIIMVFLPAVSSFAIPRLLGGGQYTLIGNLIEKQFYLLGDWNFGSAISVVIMVLILFSMMFMKRTEDIKERGGGTIPW